MAICKSCGVELEWAKLNGNWTPLMPVGTEGLHERTHVDSKGNLRALHRVICDNQGSLLTLMPLVSPVRICDLPVKKRAKRKTK